MINKISPEHSSFFPFSVVSICLVTEHICLASICHVSIWNSLVKRTFYKCRTEYRNTFTNLLDSDAKFINLLDSFDE